MNYIYLGNFFILVTLFLSNLFSNILAFAADRSDADNLGLVYYDGDDLQIDRKTGNITAQGNVLFFVAGAFVSADKIIYQKEVGLLTAEGNVKILRNKERLTGSRAVLDQTTSEFRMDDVQIIVDPRLSSQVINEEVLGFTLEEMAFEISRGERENELTKELIKLRDKYVAQINMKKVRRGNTGSEEDEISKIVRRYSQILERLARTKYQPNTALNELTADQRKRIERRRDAAKDFAKKNPSAAKTAIGLNSVPGYVRIKASQIYQNPAGTYEITDANLTACRCDDTARPAWGLSAKSGNIELQKYVTLVGSTFDILDVPILYSPWLKFPIKTQRETGFLLPSFYASRSGEVFSQPFYLALGEHADATLTYNDFTRRGQRIDTEARLQIAPNSRVRLYGEFIKDRATAPELELNKQKVYQEIAKRKDEASKNNSTLNPSVEENLLAGIGEQRTSRWYSQGSWNLPMTATSAIKTDAEFVSDNRYLGDFSKETGGTQDLFSPSVNSRRFLTHDAAAEYYGNEFVLSARAQGVRDVFSAKYSDTPVRLPRIEFSLLPKRYFDLPIAIGNEFQWERVHRLGGSSFIDVNPSGEQSQLNAPVLGNDQSTAITLVKNGRRDPTEPYVEGERSYTQSTATLPLPANDYLNAFLSATGYSTQYSFPAANPYPKNKQYQTYSSYIANLNMPIYGLLTLSEKENQPYAVLRNDVNPQISFEYIPQVNRTTDFPKAYQLFYSADDVTSKENLVMSISSSFSISKEKFESTESNFSRLQFRTDPGVANTEIFKAIIQEKKLSFENSPESLFAFSGVSQAPLVFEGWALKELNLYQSMVAESDFGKSIIWPDPFFYRRTSVWNMQPLTLNLKTSYNFAAAKTVEERNARKRPGESLERVQPWGNVEASANWSLSPILPISGGFFSNFDRTWDRIKSAGASISGSPGYGLTLGFSNSYEVKVDSPPQYPMKRTLSTNISYQPFNWLVFQYQKQMILADAARSDPEFEYEGLQKISFLSIQDCLDIHLKRYKSAAVREQLATWSMEISLKFLGYSRDIGNVGESVDRSIKERNMNKKIN